MACTRLLRATSRTCVMTELAAREVVIARVRPHARVLFWPSLVLIAVSAGYGFFGSRFDESWQNIVVLCVSGLLVIVGWLLPLLSWLARNYTITTRRLVLRSGVFVRVRQELLFSRAFDVTVRQAGLQALFRSGDVLVSLGRDGRLVMKDVPSADLIQQTLHDLIEANGGPRLDQRIL